MPKITGMGVASYEGPRPEDEGESESSSSVALPSGPRPRTCGICHQPGHNRLSCPQSPDQDV